MGGRSMERGRRIGLVGAVAALVVLVGAATAAAHVESGAHVSASTVKVGIIYSRTGALAGFGNEYAQGFRLGLRYATHGTNKVDGHKLQITYVDDATDAAKAFAAGKDLIGQGYKILAGSTSSGIALQMGPLAAQNKVLFFAEDTAFGASNVAAVRAVFGGKGHTVSSILVPFNAADLTPFAQRLKNANADLVF